MGGPYSRGCRRHDVEQRIRQYGFERKSGGYIAPFCHVPAKFLWSSDQEKSNSNPWIASLLAYVSAGDRGAIQDLPAAQHHVNVAVQAGWTMQDVLQVVEWNKGSMPIYPALAQWAQLFGTSQAQVLQAQHRLAPTMIELLEPREQHAWALTQALGLSFQDWTAQLKANPVQPTLKLPELGI